MASGARRSNGITLETDRLLLRPWRPAEAPIWREMWGERDPRVPPHRRIDADGNPTLEALEVAIRRSRPTSVGLLAAERRGDGEVVGYCGLVDSEVGAPGEPELAFEFLRRSWGNGFATEASSAVLGWARANGHRRLWATVWDWNTASRQVLVKLGFVEVRREETTHGVNLVTTLTW
jgi:ribosomal-protein-alanine N-acetyltransferase